MVGKHIFVSGRVQGVGFRYFTSDRANELGLRGWVRNLPDGRVEILAFGEREKLAEFLKLVHQGPANADVSNCVVEEVEEKRPLENFQVRRDGGPLWP